MRQVYLDNNATTAVAPEVLAAMLPFLTEYFANPSSSHGPGARVAEAVRDARRAVRELLGAALDQEIVFTSGGTEADNAAILSALETQTGRNEVVISAVEHPALLTLCAHLERHRGMVVHRIGVDGLGRLDIQAYRKALGPRTAIASVMWANNETGTLFPVELLARLAHEAGALFHTDAVQAVGKHPINLQSTAIDMLSLSAHKLNGPKGVGALYLRKGTPFQPLILGGKQERARRGGTENVPGIAGLGQAARRATAHLADGLSTIAALRDRLEQGIMARIPSCAVAGDAAHRLANTTTIIFDRAEAEPILDGLDHADVAASSGSACTSGAMEPSHVLRAMGVAFTAIHGAIRFSLSRDTNAADIDHVLAVLPQIVARARTVSLFAGGSEFAEASAFAEFG